MSVMSVLLCLLCLIMYATINLKTSKSKMNTGKNIILSDKSYEKQKETGKNTKNTTQIQSLCLFSASTCVKQNIVTKK